MATTTATVESITVVSLFGMRRSVAGAMLCQSKVPTATMTTGALSDFTDLHLPACRARGPRV